MTSDAKNTKGKKPGKPRSTVQSRRRIKLIEILSLEPLKWCPLDLAGELDCSESTICRDLAAPEVIEAVSERIREVVSGELVRTAWRNVATAINAGDVKVSQWLIGESNFFPTIIDLRTEDLFSKYQERLGDARARIETDTANPPDENGMIEVTIHPPDENTRLSDG